MLSIIDQNFSLDAAHHYESHIHAFVQKLLYTSIFVSN